MMNSSSNSPYQSSYGDNGTAEAEQNLGFSYGLMHQVIIPQPAYQSAMESLLDTGCWPSPAHPPYFLHGFGRKQFDKHCFSYCCSFGKGKTT